LSEACRTTDLNVLAHKNGRHELRPLRFGQDYRNFAIEILTSVGIVLYNEGDGMPQTTLLVFQAQPNDVPLREWLADLEETEPRAFAACLERIQRLEINGFELRRPAAEHLGDGIYELRAKRGRVHYRILYFFCGRNIACLTHGFTKEGAIPPAEIDRATRARELVKTDQDRYTVEWWV
jgi:phage-related protein